MRPVICALLFFYVFLLTTEAKIYVEQKIDFVSDSGWIDDYSFNQAIAKVAQTAMKRTQAYLQSFNYMFLQGEKTSWQINYRLASDYSKFDANFTINALAYIWNDRGVRNRHVRTY